MKRRTFIKGIAAGSGLLLASTATFTSISRADDDEPVHHLENRANPSTLEKKHVPAIEAPSTARKGEWFNVKVRVGYLIEHPSQENHWIENIELRVDRWKLAETEYEIGGLSAPWAEFKIRLNKDAVLKARAECNLHGTWESDPVQIRVT